MTRKTVDEQGLFDAVSGWRRGMFTSKEAAEHGYSPALLAYHAHKGKFRHLARGLYRFRLFPSDRRDALVQALMEVDPDHAIVSHSSALDLHELTDVVPRYYEFTIPRECRYRVADLPEFIRAHTTTQPLSDESESIQGIPVTSAAKSIVDAGNAGIGLEQIQMAVRNALQLGKASRRDFERVSHRAVAPVRRVIESALEGLK